MDRRNFLKNTGITVPLFSAFGAHGMNLASVKSDNFPNVNVERRIVDGIADVFVDGKMIPRTWGSADMPGYYGHLKPFQYKEGNVNTYFTCLFNPYMFGWDGRDYYDYSEYEGHLERIIEQHPNIQLIMYCASRRGCPPYWCKDNKGELFTYMDGMKKNIASFASEKWLKEGGNALVKFVQHFENSKYAKSIIGYNPTMSGQEWLMPSDEKDGNFGDFSKPMLLGFQKWLKEYYQNNVEILQRNWKSKTVTFNNATIPTAEERTASKGQENFFYHIENLGTKVADYYRCYNESVAKLAIGFSKIIKEACNNKKLVGMCQAYTFVCPSDCPNPMGSSHNAVKMLVSSPYIDYFHSPYSYYNRSLNGTHYSQNSVDTILLHGKLMVSQNDSKLHMKDTYSKNSWTPYESIQLMSRDISYMLSKNGHMYYYDISDMGTYRAQKSVSEFNPFHYDSPELREHVGKLAKIANENQLLKPQNIREVALFKSTDSAYYRKVEKVFSKFFAEGMRQWQMPYVSCPFDDYIFEDFENINYKYKVYIFMDAFYVRSETRKKIRKKIEEDGATAIWFYAPGYVDENGPSLANIEELTGFKVQKKDEKGFLHIDISESNHPYHQNLDTNNFGSNVPPYYFKETDFLSWPMNRNDYQFTPRFYVDDAEAIKLGAYCKTGDTGYAVKKIGRGTSIYFGAPIPPSKLLTNIFREAGVHIYSSTQDLINANKRFVAFCNRSGAGTKTLHLPLNSTIEDAFTGEKLAQNSNELRFEAKYSETKIFKITPLI